ncbi:hypothetical protein SXCC_02584 [Gluconacetobacter sp. SXCC-1]|nr:hypothetical protein SXCC_02584 [Gluconacetobacter sp. SXCC-1]
MLRAPDGGRIVLFYETFGVLLPYPPAYRVKGRQIRGRNPRVAH